MPLAFVLVGMLFWATVATGVLVWRTFMKTVHFVEHHGTRHGPHPV